MAEKGATWGRRARSWLLAGALASCLGGCGTIARAPVTMEEVARSPHTRELDRFRFPSADERPFLRWLDVWASERRRLGMDGVRGLALSGGGANGAYGAGVLVGWSERGDRPPFDLVTGVSTGALTAPLAFAGQAWDGRLAQAYHDPMLVGLTRGRFGFLRNPSLYDAAPLEQLVDRYVDQALLIAVAQEHRRGRRLLVATTNLDTQASVIWDLGAIAAEAQTPSRAADALTLFRQVLIAAASLPAVFPPTLISADPEGRITEMHVDGGVTAPFFLVPETLNFWRPEREMRPIDLYMIINGPTVGSRRLTAGRATDILPRTLETLGHADARNQLRFVSAFAARNGARVRYAAMPDGLDANPLAFDLRHMGELFDLGRGRSVSGTAFLEPGVLEWLRDEYPDAAKPALKPTAGAVSP